MNSSIKVDFAGDGKGLQPVIRVRLSSEGDDVRDGLLKAFFEQLGNESSWLVVSFDHHIIAGNKDSNTYVTISPLTPNELPETLILIQKRINNLSGNLNPLSTPVSILENKQSNKFEVVSITRDGNRDKDGTPMHYKLVVTKSLKGLREGILKEAIEDVINDPDNFVE